jgi:RNA polymerase sigma-70 factor (ECF subfamily)
VSELSLLEQATQKLAAASNENPNRANRGVVIGEPVYTISAMWRDFGSSRTAVAAHQTFARAQDKNSSAETKNPVLLRVTRLYGRVGVRKPRRGWVPWKFDVRGRKSDMAREPFSRTDEREISKMLVVSPSSSTVVPPKTEELGREVFEACQCGDRDALREFVHCYERRVFAYLSRSLGQSFPIEDLAQEVFVRAYPALSRFELEGEAKLSTWLLSIAHRVAVDARRKERAQKRGESGAFEPECYASSQPSPEERLRQGQLVIAVARAVEQLTPSQRDVFILATFHELSIAEIAEVVGSFEATVKTRLFRAKAKLRLSLGPQFAVMP